MSVNILNTENFAELRQFFRYYVDKTGFLVDFLQDPTDASRFRAPASATLFTRPRRFGKTLFMTMLAEFFDIKKQGNGQNLFEGLAVSANEKLCQEWMHQYPVISISLKDVNPSTFTDTLNSIQRFVSDICIQNIELLNSSAVDSEDRNELKLLHGKKADTDTLGDALFILTRAMSSHYGKSAIILIDEYDVPVAMAAEKGYYAEMIEFMRRFLSRALKTNSYLKFAILTGALRITKESFFSGLNNLDCYDISDDEYSDVFGFTQCEVDQLLACAGLEEKRDMLKEWYDGYHFGERNDIYCPWSIMKYLKSLRINPRRSPKIYWVNTSTNNLTKGFVNHVPASIQDDMASLLAGNSIKVQINETLNYNQLYDDTNNFWTLLYLTGYLTPTSDDSSNDSYSSCESRKLTIPNREVMNVFKKEIQSWFNNIVPTDIQEEFFKKFWKPDAQGLEKMLNERILTSACFLDYQYGEHFYHSLLLGIFFDYMPDSNRAAGTGIPDLAIHDKDSRKGAVIEVKRARSEDELDKCVQAALEQIADRNYDERLKLDGRDPILHWGMAFFKKSCRVAVRLA